MKSISLAFVACLFLITGCSKDHSRASLNAQNAVGLRSLTGEEKSADFDQLLELFRTNYGPYQYKEKRFGMNIEKMIMDIKAQSLNAKTDEEFMGYVMQVSAALQDGHVQFRLENSASNVSNYKIPVMVAIYEGRAIAADVAVDLNKWSGLAIGDEILLVDGKTPSEILTIALKYRRAAQPLSDLASSIYTFLRPSYMTDLIPQKPTSVVQYKRVDGSVATVEIPWETEKWSASLEKVVRQAGVLDFSVPFAEDFNSILPKGHRAQMGQVNPIFLTEQTKAKYKFVQVTASVEMMKRMGLKGDEKPGIYAALYRYNGKTIFLLRQPAYSHEDYSNQVYLKTYKALIKEYQDLADVMVLDQTHNPGGSYCAEFYNLFAKQGDVSGVEQARADRKWVNDLYVNWPKELAKEPTANPWELKQLLSWGALVEKAYDQGQFLSEPIALFTGSPYAVQYQEANWSKPMLVLIDELAGSCGDIFPMLVKANKRALLFGQTTMGLGGNVEAVGQLNNSRVTVRMTRGLFFPFRPDGKYSEADFIENNGVSPDIEYSHTVEDFRNGYVDYVKAFSEKALTVQ